MVKQVRVDFGALEFALQWEDEIQAIRQRIGADCVGRYVGISHLDPGDALRDMADFAWTVMDARLRNSLMHALQGRCAFHEFRQVKGGTR